jgi:hypothetical protein
MGVLRGVLIMSTSLSVAHQCRTLTTARNCATPKTFRHIGTHMHRPVEGRFGSDAPPSIFFS